MTSRIKWVACGPGKRSRRGTLGRHEVELVPLNDGQGYVVLFMDREMERFTGPNLIHEMGRARRHAERHMAEWIADYEAKKAADEAALEARIQEILAERRAAQRQDQ